MNTDQYSTRPTAERPMLVGLLVDVSGSMMSAIQNRSHRSMNRLESFRDSFGDLVARGRELSTEGVGGTIAPLVKIFAYGFGFGNPLSFLFGSGGPKVRDLLDLPGQRSSTISIDSLAENWDSYQSHVERMATDMFGDTPMGSAFQIVNDRLKLERQKGDYTGNPVLFVLSDGEPTDYSSDEIVGVANELKDAGTLIVSCFVTDEDLTEPRRIYGSPQNKWSPGARLMFECSSVLPVGSSFEAYMREYNWKLEPDGRLFTQINQSEILSEFISVVLSPLKSTGKEIQPSGETRDSVRVFVSYSHQDANYLKQDELLGYLKGLENEGFEFWHDERILTSQPWDERIQDEINRADIALVLVSQAFLNSKYCQVSEIANFLTGQSERGLEIFPVIISACDWKSHAWLANTQFQPRGGATIEGDFTDRGKRYELYLKILEEIRHLGREIRSRRI
jgi:hypothetical protein